ncbi:anti-sigma factor RsiW [Kineococcus radiotolerans]|uniref:Anti-sigma factor RsiW n=1 Tax=Kineococcus radiotolerans TaxID=131568 RepID=A0A7W4XVY9_KINRA|nr:zf-HC2 domain-containing protein [Kineococcus radiotolerans]MBB2899595.1 anti-sigma factor RsiW [Kineococcus radiotolerans]
MDADRDDPFATTAGPYVLGALAPAERSAFETHLRTCPDCRHAVEGLAGLPGLLSRTPRDVVDALGREDPAAALRERGLGEDAVPDTVLPALLRAVRRRRTTRRAALAGGLGLAAALAGAFAWSGGDPSAPAVPSALPGATSSAPSSAPSSATPGASPGPGRVQAMDPLLPVPVTATVQLTEVGWGTQVDLVCAYAHAEAEQPHPYALVVSDTAGATQQIGTWTALPGRDAQLSGATSWTRAQIASVEVRTLSGTTVLRLDET